MSKRDKKPPKPSIAPAALLRVRLEGLWLNPAAPAMTAQLEADLSAATRGLKPAAVGEVVLSVFKSAPADVQAQLEEFLPQWLASHDVVDTLERLIKGERLPEALQPIAVRWLAALGREVGPLHPKGPDSFYKAWTTNEEWQAAVSVLWYSNPHKNRVRGLQFLIDNNPPWDGAIKDVLMFPNQPPESLERLLEEMWPVRGMAMTPVDAAEAKRKLMVALKQNESAGIRLPVDLVMNREQFFKYVLALPDAPDTPAFSADDFNILSETGRRAEELMLFEQTVGRRIRLEDGKELFIDASIANESFNDWDELEDADEDNNLLGDGDDG